MDSDYYDSISGGYDELYGEEQLRKAEIIARHIKPRKTENLLDVGCGSAIYFQLFDCDKLGIDPSLELLKKANEEQQGRFIQAVAENLPFKDQSFDYIISLTAVHNFSSPEKGLAEIKRVAKSRIALSILRQSQRPDEIEKTIRELFTIRKLILEDKDIIFILDNKV